MIYLQELYDAQKDLDAFIMKTKGIQLPKQVILTDTLLGLSVEVAELANEIRSFKHWSNKGQSPKPVVLEEYVDVLHFFLSMGNQLGFTADEVARQYFRKNLINRDRMISGY